MINIGKFNSLKICKQRDNEVFLEGGDDGDILLNPKDVKQSVKIGDQLSVFIYPDGQGLLQATTQKPLAQVNDVAWLKVVSISHAGAFLDWGLPKDLLVPYSEQKIKMVEDKHYLVKLFLDESNRIAASTLLDDFIRDEAVYLKEGEKVDLMIADETDLGIKAIINNEFWGVLYKNELFKTIRKGQKLTGFIKKIRADKKIDLTLSLEKFADKVDVVADQIITRLEQQGGEMAITDKSPPELIYDSFSVSKKVFKQAVGRLYKKRKILIEQDSIKLTDQ